MRQARLGRDEKLIRNHSLQEEIEQLRDLGVDGRLILKHMFMMVVRE
jgi:hypothetical protein